MENQFNESFEESNPIQKRPIEKQLFGPATMEQFKKAGKWAKTLSILIFVLLSLVVIFAILTASFLLMSFRNVEVFLGFMIVFLYIGILSIVLFTVYKLYKFSKYVQEFSISGNDQDLNKAFTSLKQFFLNITLFIIATGALYFISMLGMYMFMATGLTR